MKVRVIGSVVVVVAALSVAITAQRASASAIGGRTGMPAGNYRNASGLLPGA